MRLSKSFVLFLLLVAFSVPSACGKKGPPLLPKRQMSLAVEQLRAEWRDGRFFLQGKITEPKDQIDDPSGVTGCRIVYASYPADDAPCEGCPIDYRGFKEIEGKVIDQDRFACEFSEEKAEGVYFFKVCLMGQKGESGPYSDRVKLVVAP